MKKRIEKTLNLIKIAFFAWVAMSYLQVLHFNLTAPEKIQAWNAFILLKNLMIYF